MINLDKADENTVLSTALHKQQFATYIVSHLVQNNMISVEQAGRAIEIIANNLIRLEDKDIKFRARKIKKDTVTYVRDYTCDSIFF